jgi:hypothetical protein
MGHKKLTPATRENKSKLINSLWHILIGKLQEMMIYYTSNILEV